MSSHHHSSESEPLLPNGNGSRVSQPSVMSRLSTIIKAEGEPTWLQSYRFFIFGTWFNVLLIFIPLSFIAHQLNLDAALRFSFSFIAIIPLAKVCAVTACRQS